MDNKQKQEKLIDDLLNGKATLYSMSDIQKKLSISRSTLNRWIKNGENHYFAPKIRGHLFESALLQDEEDDDLTTIFPQPDLYIGNSPRWAKETVKNWILSSQKNK